MGMTKLVILHHLPDNNDRPALERWFAERHCPEVCAQAPWLTRYVLYRPVPPPPGGGAFGYINYRVHENWVRDSDRRGVKGLLSFSEQPGYMEVAIANVHAEPTEDFFGAQLRHADKSILRWLILFRYPDGVSEEEGEDWYLNVHAPEVCRQPGLTRFFSHRAAPSRPIHDPSDGQAPFMPKVPALMGKRWHRVSEQWYENDNGWVRSIVERPPTYTKPPWARHETYPFLVPGDEFVSTFLLERPDQDFLRHGEYRYF